MKLDVSNGIPEDADEVSFIYASTSCEQHPDRMEALNILRNKYDAEVVLSEHVGDAVILMTEEELTEEELLTAGSEGREN